MSDIEKAISGLVEDEELLQKQQQQQQQQYQQQATTTVLNKANINSYNLQNETGTSSLLHPHPQPQHSSSTNANSYLTVKQHNCLSRAAKLIFSTPGLVVMVVVYTIMGAFIFPLLEAPQDISKSALIAKSREECLKELWIITEKLNVLYERNWTMLVHEQLRRFEGTIVAATRNMAAGTTVTATTTTLTTTSGVTNAVGVGGGTVAGAEVAGISTELPTATTTTTTALGHYGGNNLMEYSDLTATRWSFSEALLYSVTVITTIGHGSLTPRTAGGKIATIFYALIGVPLMLMCLSSLGALLAEALQCTYAKLCCRWPQYTVENGDDLDSDITHTKHLQNQRLKQPQHHTSRGKKSVEKETPLQIKQRLQHQHHCEMQEQTKNGINCKNCKYDGIIGETNTNHSGYDYKLCNDATTMATASATSLSTSEAAVTASAAAAAATTIVTTTPAMTTIKLGHKEDCCQLLQNSPGKFTQHLSSCMQLKGSPTMALSGGAGGGAGGGVGVGGAMDTTQQQQQYYQQRPDVMLMTTGHKLSSQQPTTMATASCRIGMPQTPSQAQTQTQARFYANATPAMATYHIVSSASANSSPTHHQSIRHYLVPQIPAPTTASLLQAASATAKNGTTQHFMAVPSSMLRFHQQTSPQTTLQQQQQQHSVNTVSNININPLALPVSGAATVYFPIVTPAANGSQNSTQSASLIKYHTIQMPHKRQQQHGLTLLQQTDLHENHHQVINTIEDDVGSSTSFPPPPPPAYQTATVHGIRRAKFVSKPLPQEINTLLHESDISCRHDLMQNFSTFSNGNNNKNEQQLMATTIATTVLTPTSSTPPTVYPPPTTHSLNLLTNNGNDMNQIETNSLLAAPTVVSSYYGSITDSSASSAVTLTNTHNNAGNFYENHESAASHMLLQHQHQPQQLQQTHVVYHQTQTAAPPPTLSSLGAPAAPVDIMEDEDDQEQHSLGGDCPHGTPSRVPLLTSSPNSTENKSHTRSFLNATAASFHRHTLNTFQRPTNSLANQPKSVVINRKGECNLHIPKRRSSSICYGDQYDDTSDDDCGGLEGSNIYKLKHLHHHIPHTSRHYCHSNQTGKQFAQADFCDNHSLVSLSDSTSQIPQVPIIVVLLILTLYVSLGTVIFALWENWSLIDGAYFCFVTLTTIGYGDFMPWQTFQGPDIQLFACCAYLLLGLVLVAMSFSILETQLIWKCKRLAVRLKLAKE